MNGIFIVRNLEILVKVVSIVVNRDLFIDNYVFYIPRKIYSVFLFKIVQILEEKEENL